MEVKNAKVQYLKKNFSPSIYKDWMVYKVLEINITKLLYMLHISSCTWDPPTGSDLQSHSSRWTKYLFSISFRVSENYVPLKIQYYWAMTLYWLINTHHSLRRTSCFHLQDLSSPEPEDGSKLLQKGENYLSINMITCQKTWNFFITTART